MPFDIGQSINSITESALRNPSITHVAENPFYTALLIATIVILTVMIVFRNSENDDHMYIMLMRTGFWAFVSISFIILLHDKILTREQQEGIVPNLFTAAPITGEYESLIVPIIDI